jgi:hypothetical protein
MLASGVDKRSALLAILACSAAGCGCYSSTVGDDDDDDSAKERDAEAGREDGGVEGSEPIRLDESGSAYFPQVAMDGDGNGTVVFIDSWRVVARRWESSAWADKEQLGFGDYVLVDFNASGQGVAAWRNGVVSTAALWAPGAGWLGSEDIGSAEEGTDGVASLAIDGAGNVMVAFDGDTAGERVKTTRHEPATGWSEPALVEPFEVYTVLPNLDANEAGDFVGVWMHFVEGKPIGSPHDETSWWSRQSDGWQAPGQIGPHQSTGWPRVSVDEAGNALLVGSDVEAGVFATWQRPGEPPGDFEYLGPDDRAFDSRDVVATGDGAAFVARAYRGDLIVTRCDPAQSWQDRQTIDVLDSYEVYSPSLAADANGNALAVWAQHEGDTSRIWAARYVADRGWLDPFGVSDPIEADAYWPSLGLAPDGTALVAWIVPTQPAEEDEVFAEVWARIFVP